jgi:multisubunit Na+/H+ antiporter MnhB subunit
MKTGTGMTLIVKTVSRVTCWLILVYGAYIILHGHLTPGGGFAGGVIIALAFLNILLAFGRDFTQKWLNLRLLQDLEASTAILFLVVGLLGLAISGTLLANFLSKGQAFRLASSGTILVLNCVIGVKVAMSLFLAVWTLAIHSSEGEEES